MSHTAAHEEMRELAALYALGALEAQEARAFEEHLAEGCIECAAELGEYESVAAELALTVAPVAPSAGVRERLLARVSEEKGRREGGAESAPSQFTGASDFLVVREAEGEWVETSDTGVSVKLLFVDKERDTVTTLVRLAPGASISRHRHLGVEQCLVLEGEVHSGGLLLRGGDFNCAMRGSVHDEISTETGALLLLVSPESYEALGRGGESLPSI